MQAETVSRTDWRDSAAYAPLLDADRSLLAWEWLRRDPLYRAAVNKSSARAAQFGLVEFESPNLRVPDARPFWRADAYAYVLRVVPVLESAQSDRIDLSALSAFASVIASPPDEHLLFCDGLRTIRLDGPEGAFTSGPAALRYILEGLGSAEPPLLTLRRLLALCRAGKFARSLHRSDRGARRRVLMLRVADALAAGADQREIARELLSTSAGERRWRIREPSIRSQVQRLVRGARQIAAGGYRELLGQRLQAHCP